ncbi:hypothetical protein [Microbacterium oleivorans]|uniref:hypothetical protein n=1 Tax=Microbacterium oleivorans TaxID=273677 RepID=UPI0020418A05|nr:hypothetical protein [Microbacterium oleivorans]MCM3696611.1 hypothetical protein [Microbacterium oleivorans]
MPYRRIAVLESWLTEYQASVSLGGLVRVVPLVGEEDTDIGLIVFPLGGGTTSVHIEPIRDGDSRWRVHFEPRDHEAIMSSSQVHTMAAELQMVARLCDFLEMKSAEHLARADG